MNPIAFKVRTKTILIGFICLIGVACAQQPPAEEEPSVVNLESIRSLISTKCKTNDHCKVIGVGFMACGGNKSYMTYSSLTSNEKEVKERVNQYNRDQKKANNGRPGVCLAIKKPVSYCSTELEVCTTKVNRSETK